MFSFLLGGSNCCVCACAFISDVLYSVYLFLMNAGKWKVSRITLLCEMLKTMFLHSFQFIILVTVGLDALHNDNGYSFHISDPGGNLALIVQFVASDFID
jgi:hypothetical protein